MGAVFISYASDDRKRVAKLARALEKRGLTVWWDRDVMPGDDYRAKIDTALSQSAAVIVAWSRVAATSEWVIAEAEEARATGKLVSVTLDGTLPPKPFGVMHTENLKSWSGGASDLRMRRLEEAVRAIREGRAALPVRATTPWLTWGAVGGVAAAALAVAANLGTVTGWFTPDREVERLSGEIEELKQLILAQTAPETGEVDPERRADRERAAKDIAREETGAARLIAEGRLDEGFDALEDSAERDMATAARKWREIGQLAYDREPARALEAYRQATALDGSDFWAWIYLSRLEQSHAGNLTAARAAAEAALEVAGSEREQLVARGEVGDIEIAAGNLNAARQQFEKVTGLTRALAAADPASASAKRDVSVSLNKLGDVARAEGDLGAARAAYTEGLETRRALAAADPASASAKRDVSVSLDRLGDVAVAEGDLGAARAAFTEGLETRRALAAADPASASAKRDVIVNLAKLAQMTGDKDYWRQALTVVEDMATNGQLAPADAWMLDEIRSKAE